MSQLPDLSRRKLLRMASFSSLVLLGGPACARHRNEMREVIARELPNGAGIPEDCQTEKNCSQKPVDTEKFFKIAEILWTKFLAGAHPTDVEEGVFKRAFEMTGPFVICNIEQFSTDGNHVDTNNCSVQCGQEAAKLAQSHGPDAKIDKADFEAAWCIVQKQMREALTRLRARSPGGDGQPSGGMGC